MGSPEPPRSWDDLPDDVNDEWRLTYEKVTDDDLPCMKPSHKALEERVNQLEQDAKKWERADSEHVRAARFEQERANAAVERVNQLEKALDCGGVNCGECRACLATDLVLAYAALSGDAK